MKTHIFIPVALMLGVLAGILPAYGASGVPDGIPEATSQKYLTDSMPAEWEYNPEFQMTSPADDQWWHTFGDAVLDSLISRAQTHNYSLSMALKRIEMARQQLNVTRAGYWPQLGVSAGWTKSQSAGAVSNPVRSSAGSDYFSLGLNLNWEIDVFGRVTAAAKADRIAEEISRVDYDAVMLSLCADVATAYLQLRTYQNQYRVAMSHIASQEKILKITEARFEAGIGDMLEVTQAKIVLYSTKSSVPGLESGIRTAINSIAVLLGAYPQEVSAWLSQPAPLPFDSGMPAPGIPAQLLRRRPDVVEAEREVAHYAALVGVAKKDFLPALAISGSIATASHKIGGLFGKHSLDYNVAPTLTWTLFDGMARKYKVAAARLQMEESVDSYNMTVLNAVEEVENAMSQYEAKVEECKILMQLMDESHKSLDLSLDLYKQGLTAFSNVVDAQQNFLENQNSLVASQGGALSALVNLYKALGGGW